MPRFDLQQILIRILVLSLSLSVHEYAHARTAFRLGDDTAEKQGRLTLNPISHLDPLGTIAFIIIGFGWAKPVPVNPVRFSRNKVKTMRFGMMQVAIAGPISNLILAFIANFLLQIVYLIINLTNRSYVMGGNHVLDLFILILSAFYFSNLFLALFNLLPVPPLDGSRVLGAFLPNEKYYKYMQIQRYSSIILLLLIFVGGGLISKILNWISVPINFVLTYPVNALFRWLTGILS